LGDMGREVIVNGTALLIIGTPVWVYSWRLIQDSLTDSAEMGSPLRLSILYILALGGVITVITTAYMVVNVLIMRLLGVNTTFRDIIRQIGGPISVGVPLGAVWAYYGHWLTRHIEAIGNKVRQAGLKRLYNCILAFIGLVVSFVGVSVLFAFIIDMLTSKAFLIGDSNRSNLSTAVSSLIVGLPLWLMTWRPMQAEALLQNEFGDHARRSVLRKTYLYLALFTSVIGGMATAVGLVYQLIRVALMGDASSDFVNTLLNLTQILFLFGIVLVYHLQVLRADGASTADALAEKQNQFNVLIVDSGNGFVDTVKAALLKLGSKVQIMIATPTEKPNANFSAIVISGAVAVDAPEWIRSFSGNRIIVQNEAQNLVWADDAAQAAQSVQSLAEGQEIQKKKQTRSVWMYVVYVFAAFFALQLLFLLLALGISLVVGGGL